MDESWNVTVGLSDVYDSWSTYTPPHSCLGSHMRAK